MKNVIKIKKKANKNHSSKTFWAMNVAKSKKKKLEKTLKGTNNEFFRVSLN